MQTTDDLPAKVNAHWAWKRAAGIMTSAGRLVEGQRDLGLWHKVKQIFIPPEDICFAMEPDIEDDATGGVMMRCIREAWCDESAHTYKASDGWVCMVSHPTTHARKRFRATTEGRARAYALLASPRPRNKDREIRALIAAANKEKS